MLRGATGGTPVAIFDTFTKKKKPWMNSNFRKFCITEIESFGDNFDANLVNDSVSVFNLKRLLIGEEGE